MLNAPELQMATFEIRPTDTMVGAEVLGLDLSKPLDEAAFEKVSAALDSFSVVCFRDQILTSEQHIVFSRRFGPLQVNVRSEFNKPSYPEIYIVSNVLIDGKPIGSQDAGRYWHSDLCYLQKPSRASLPPLRFGGAAARRRLAWRHIVRKCRGGETCHPR
jgi:taurine dioxygenase